MASGKLPRRGPIPANLATLTSKTVISVEEWEAKAPLGDIEIQSVNAIKAAREKVPLPSKFMPDEPSSRPGTPVQLQRKFASTAITSRPSTPSVRPGQAGAHSLHPKQPVQTPQQFYDWFALVDRSVAHSQESHFRAHVANVTSHLETCDFLIGRIEEIESEVEKMLEGWRGVEDGGKSLKDACQRLLEERDRLLSRTDEIGQHLEYFQELEHATRMLNHPGESLIFQTDFLYMVERVDICIDFLKAHRHYREADVYLLRFNQCMTRAMTLIKMNFVGSMRALSSDISKRLSEKDVSDTAQMHLLYTRFKSVATKVSPLLGELERRAKAYPDELSSLLSECHTSYFTARKYLLVPRLMEEIRGLDPAKSDLVELTRAGCSYLKQLCIDEYNLCREFFDTAEDQLYQYLENLCDMLYDDLRPRILHEPKLTALCEVCTVLQALMVLDVSSFPDSDSSPSDASSDDNDDNEDSDELLLDFDAGGIRKGARQLYISNLLQMVLQDAQTRLFFKAQSVIQSEVRYYVAKKEDLEYPEILIAARKPAGAGMEMKEKERDQNPFRLPSIEKQETWYPTLRKTVWVLAQLQDFVKPAIFDDIAQEAVSLCRLSLASASENIKTRSALDGQLFLVRHLLILKDLLRNLSLESKEEESAKSGKEIGGMSDTLTSVFTKTTSFLPDSLFSSLGIRGMEESARSTKYGLDRDIRRTCEEVIIQCVNAVCSPLSHWIEHSHALSASKAVPVASPPPPPQSQTQSLPSPKTLVSKFYEDIERTLQNDVLKLRLYLEDDRTVNVLLDHVQDQIMDRYAEFRERALEDEKSTDDNGIAGVVQMREMVKRVCGDDNAVEK